MGTTIVGAISGGGGGGATVADIDQQFYTASAGQTVFPLSPTVNTDATMVFVNGVKVLTDDYTLTTSQLTLQASASATDEVCIVDFNEQASASGSGATAFTGLTDTPSSFSSQQNKFVIVNSAGNALEFIATSSFEGSGSGGGSSTFTGLTDTPSSLSGQGSKGVRVNSGGSALEFYNISSGSLALEETLTQSGHGFTAGKAIYLSGSTYTLSNSDTGSTAEVIGVVRDISGDDFTVVYDGKATITSHGFGTSGDALYLSGSSNVSNTEPSTGVSKPVGYVVDANTILVKVLRGTEIGGVDLDDNSWLVKAGDYTAAHGDNLIINASSVSGSFTFPASPNDDDTIRIAQGAGDLSSFPYTLDAGSKNFNDNIQTPATTFDLNTNFPGRLTWVYKSTLNTWILT
jgi:hypothetical protein